MSAKQPLRFFSLSSPVAKISWTLGLIVIDQLTKIWAQKSLQGQPSQQFLGDLFRLDYAENSGAFLSLGSQMPEEVRFWIFIVAVAIFLMFPIYYLFKEKNAPAIQVWALIGIASGGIGNLIDRIFRPNHAVVDFLNVGIGDLRTGIFNIADMGILFGVIALFFMNLTASDKKTNTSNGPSQRP